MNDSFRNSFVIKVSEFLSEYKIFEQGWPAGTRAKRVLVIGYRNSLVGRKGRTVMRRRLMRLPAISLRLVHPLRPCN